MRKPRSREGKKLSWERLGGWVQDPPETLPFHLTCLHKDGDGCEVSGEHFENSALSQRTFVDV